ncbi:MAG: hypothetical protein LBS33_09105 [Streptococcaceae bacterium]|nr:hypothetical protein [Streptococcaceae bacterium]
MGLFGFGKKDKEEKKAVVEEVKETTTAPAGAAEKADGNYVIVNMALNQEKVIDFLGENGYTYIGKDGIRLKFEVPGVAEDEAVKIKQLIKGTEWGKALFFNVTPA